MEIGDDEVARIRKMHEAWTRVTDPQRQVQVTRARLEVIGEQLAAVKIAPGGRAHAVDRLFESTFLPSDLVRTQLRLALHYIKFACDGQAPTLASFVVLRVAIECMATAHWLIAAPTLRVRVERFLKRMWWDTQSGLDMADIADADPDRSGANELEHTIYEVAGAIKGLDPEKVTTSKRVALGSIIQEASRAVRPSYPTLMQACWMACAGVSHGNIPVSAGIGVDANSVRDPSGHSISPSVFANFLEIAVSDLRTTVELFALYATETHHHQRPRVGDKTPRT